MQKPVIVIHGGAGLWRHESRRAGISGIKEAAEETIKLVNRSCEVCLWA